jgi:DNA-binding NtrC family response regulator
MDEVVAALRIGRRMTARLLIVDDEPAICFALARSFADRGDVVFTSASAEDALAKLGETRPDVVFLDIRLPGVSGLEAMEALQKGSGGGVPGSGNATELPPAIVVMTAHGTMEAAIQAMRNGAYDYLVKPVSLDKAAHLVDRLMESRAARLKSSPEPSTLNPEPSSAPRMVGDTPAMHELFKQIGAVAGRAMPVLVLGETGSGKELVARAIHAHGPRAGGPFVAINAAALPDTLIESELFGFEKGAFTGADRRKPGRFEEAHGGTLFLDEIGEFPPAAQAKLLRFLDDPVVTRLGGGEERRVDVRLITATHRDLQELVQRGQFRADLLYRLNVARLRVPPLRERREDIPALAAHLLSLLNPEPRTVNPFLSDEALARLKQYDWPGNVRELRNVLQQALLVARDGVILPGHLPPLTMPLPGDDALARRIGAGIDGAGEFAYDAVMLPVERELLRQIMERHGGNLSRAAEHLGLHRATLRSKLRQHGLAEEGK